MKRGRSLLVLAALGLVGLVGALGVVLERRRARFSRPLVTFDAFDVGQEPGRVGFLDDETLVSCSGGGDPRVRVWSIAGDVARVISDSPYPSGALSAARGDLVATRESGSLVVRSLPTGAVAGTLPLGESSARTVVPVVVEASWTILAVREEAQPGASEPSTPALEVRDTRSGALVRSIRLEAVPELCPRRPEDLKPWSPRLGDLIRSVDAWGLSRRADRLHAVNGRW